MDMDKIFTTFNVQSPSAMTTIGTVGSEPYKTSTAMDARAPNLFDHYVSGPPRYIPLGGGFVTAAAGTEERFEDEFADLLKAANKGA